MSTKARPQVDPVVVRAGMAIFEADEAIEARVADRPALRKLLNVSRHTDFMTYVMHLRQKGHNGISNEQLEALAETLEEITAGLPPVAAYKSRVRVRAKAQQ